MTDLTIIPEQWVEATAEMIAAYEQAWEQFHKDHPVITADNVVFSLMDVDIPISQVLVSARWGRRRYGVLRRAYQCHHLIRRGYLSMNAYDRISAGIKKSDRRSLAALLAALNRETAKVLGKDVR